MKQIIFATQNQGKVKEIKEILSDLPVEVLTMSEAGLDMEIEENGETFEANATIKAEALSRLTDALILADDSGLEIDYLGGEPGVYSARYLGKDTPYTIKNQIIIDKLAEAKGDERTARFVCVIAAAMRGKESVTTRGTIEGYIGYESRGENGFGYDPIFYVEGTEQSTAELSPEMKNAISHRGKALRSMKAHIRAILEV
ncbi:MAG: XTP/dITP diphosphatase [Cellulosilyticaceae bacterium]